MMKPKKAFTLIELLVVLAIIAILLAILYPLFNGGGCGKKPDSQGRPVESTGRSWGQTDMQRVDGR
jgi:prepilin-type N-terminal cleavage/methylation domain-containing protein